MERLEIDASGSGALLLDGPMGTELHRAGVNTSLPLWSAWGLVKAPDRVRAVHEAYVAAGADLLTTNTFRTHRRSLARAAIGWRAGELTTLAVELARVAAAGAERTVSVAGSIAPLEDCFRPDLTPPRQEREIEHGELAQALARAGVDLLLVETMPTVREAVSAVRAAASTGLPVMVGFTCDAGGRLLSGRSPAKAAPEVEAAGASAILINCTPTAALHHALARLAEATDLPIGAYGNVGHTEDSSGWILTDALDPSGYLEHARQWRRLGASILGSCCGTGPAHIAALRAWLDKGGAP